MSSKMSDKTLNQRATSSIVWLQKYGNPEVKAETKNVSDYIENCEDEIASLRARLERAMGAIYKIDEAAEKGASGKYNAVGCCHDIRERCTAVERELENKGGDSDEA